MGSCCCSDASKFRTLEETGGPEAIELAAGVGPPGAGRDRAPEKRERDWRREAEDLRRSFAAKEAEAVRAERALQKRADDLAAQLASAQQTLRLLSRSTESEGSLGRSVQEARRQLLRGVAAALAQSHARTQLWEAYELWLTWARQRQAMYITVCETRRDAQLRAVAALASAACRARLLAAYHDWAEWTLQRRRKSLEASLLEAPRVLQVAVRKALRLVVDSKFKFGNPDPYVCLITARTRIQTGVQRNTVNPVWEETHLLALEPKAQAFRVEVFDSEKRASHGPLAAQDVVFGDLPRDRTVELTVPLKVRHGHEWADSPDTMLYLGLTPRGPGWL